MRIREQGRTTGNLGHRADVGSDDGTGAGHRLEDRQAEGLVERRVDEEIRRLIEAGGLLVRHRAYEDDIARDAELVHQLVQLGGVLLVPLGSKDDELAARELVPRQPPRMQEPIAVLIAPEG